MPHLSARRLTALALAALTGLALIAVIGTALLRTPTAFRLSSSRPPSHTQAAAAPSAEPLLAACGQTAAPRSSAAGVAGTWLVGPGSEAGYRAHEKFAVLQSPHEAVARTPRVAGSATLAPGAGASLRLERACFAVDLSSLKSQDALPGFNTADRDDLTRDLLNTGSRPYATFTAPAVDLPASAGQGAISNLRVPGQFQVNGTERPNSAVIDSRISGGEMQLVGSLVVNTTEHGVEVPNGADFVSVDPRITVEFSLRLTRAD
jgi:hypothetical protein